MTKKIILAAIISILLIGGFFYVFRGRDSSRSAITGEWLRETQPAQQVLGEGAEKKREFEGCKDGQLNINLASAKDLEVLTGIGQAISQRIIEEREKGLFYSIDDLSRVSGIGDTTVANIKEQGLACASSLDESFDILPSETAESVKESDKKATRSFTGCSEGQININTADTETLEMIVQIGSARAEQIIQLRQEVPFYSLDDLARIPGVAESTISQIKEQELACADFPDQEFFIEEEMGPDPDSEPDPDPEPDSGSEPKEDPEEKTKEREFVGCSDGQVNLNSASKEELMEITQIGISYADQIIELRKEKPFWSVNDLDRVTGIVLGGGRLESISEQGLACAADPDDTSFEPYEPASSSSDKTSVPEDEKDEEEKTEEITEEEKEAEITLSYPDENPTDQEIEVIFYASNLENTLYDVKISIEKEGILSRIYNTDSDKWISSNFYLTEVFSGPFFDGKFQLKIREDRSDFQGEADIIARVRESGKTGYSAEFRENINIFEPEPVSSEEDPDDIVEEDPEEEIIEKEPELSLSYPEEVFVDEEIEVVFTASILENASYDVKISIESDGVLSRVCKLCSKEENWQEQCLKDDDQWQSSFHYLNGFFEGTEFSGNFLLRIRDDKEDLPSEAKIIARLRESGGSTIAEFEDKINLSFPEPEPDPDPEPDPEPEPEPEPDPEQPAANLLLNEFFDSWEQDNTKPSYWSGSHSFNTNWFKNSEYVLAGDYSIDVSGGGERKLDQFVHTMEEGIEYYSEVWASGFGSAEIRIGIRDGHHWNYGWSDWETLTAGEWKKITALRIPTGTGSEGGLRIETRDSDEGQEIFIGAAWLGTGPPFEDWLE